MGNNYHKHSEHEIAGFFGDYRFLSNFYPGRVFYQGMPFASTEVAFQAAKCASPVDMKAFTRLNSLEAKKKGRIIALRKDWKSIRLPVMMLLTIEKYLSHPDLCEQLLATEDRCLIELNHWRDSYWGVDIKAGGENNLGKILMEVRGLFGGTGIVEVQKVQLDLEM